MGVAALLGSPIKRREDPRLITGQATYVDDIKLPGMLHMAVVRSPYGHAHIKSINTDAARKYPGVVAVYTAADIKGIVGTLLLPCPWGKLPKEWACVAHWPRAKYDSTAIPSPSWLRR